MGMFDGLFGGNKKQDTRSGEQQTLMDQVLYPLLSSGLQQGATPYTGKLSVGLPKYWNTYLNNLMKQSSGWAGGLQNTSNTLQSVLSGTPSFTPSTPAQYEQWFRSGVAAPALRMFDQDIAPRIKESFASVGNNFTSRAGNATARALESLNTNLSSQLAQNQNQNYMANQALAAQLADSARQRQLGGLTMAMSSPQLSQAGALEQVLGPMLNLQQSALDRKYQDFLRTAGENNPWLGSTFKFLSEPTKTFVGSQGALGNLNQLLGTGMMAGTMFGGQDFMRNGLGGGGAGMASLAPLLALALI